MPFSIDEPHRAKASVTYLNCLRQHRFKYRLQLTSRTADRRENVGGGGMLLKRFTQLVEQACGLNGNDGLRGDVLHQLKLRVVERADLLAVNVDGADKPAFFEHWYG